MEGNSRHRYCQIASYLQYLICVAHPTFNTKPVSIKSALDLIELVRRFLNEPESIFRDNSNILSNHDCNYACQQVNILLGMCNKLRWEPNGQASDNTKELNIKDRRQIADLASDVLRCLYQLAEIVDTAEFVNVKGAELREATSPALDDIQRTEIPMQWYALLPLAVQNDLLEAIHCIEVGCGTASVCLLCRAMETTVKYFNSLEGHLRIGRQFKLNYKSDESFNDCISHLIEPFSKEIKDKLFEILRERNNCVHGGTTYADYQADYFKEQCVFIINWMFKRIEYTCGKDINILISEIDSPQGRNS